MTLKLSYVLLCDWMLCPHPSKSVLGRLWAPGTGSRVFPLYPSEEPDWAGTGQGTEHYDSAAGSG